MPKQYNAQAIAQLWVQRASSAADRMKAGVNAVVDSPMEKAAQAAPQWLAGVQKAASEGTFEAGLRKVSLSDWKQKMLNKGIPNMATGVREALPDMTKFLTEFLPYAAQVSDDIKAMPKGSKEDSRARMNAAFDKMSAFKRRS